MAHRSMDQDADKWYKWEMFPIYIQNMYKGIKSMRMSSEFVNCNIGVRQGENLSPFLFSLHAYMLYDKCIMKTEKSI